MKAEIRISATKDSGEKHLASAPKNIFQVIRLYYKARKLKATGLLIWFK